MKKLYKWFMDLLSDDREPDAKRLAGFLGWLVCLLASIIGIFVAIQSIETIEILFWTSCILLGIDGIVNIVKYRNRKINPPSNIENEEE